MKIALFAMPDSASSFDNVMRMPNLGLCAIAAHLPEHDVGIYDLVLTPRAVAKTVRRILAEHRPQIVGLSAMSFQFSSAVRIARIVREMLPETTVVLGGYHASVLFEKIMEEQRECIDYVVRGEGEETFRELVEWMNAASAAGPETIRGLSWRDDAGAVHHNPARENMDISRMLRPRRSARRLQGFSYFGRRFDCVETSRGCTFPCTFCSIRSMYGRTFREREIDDVVREVVELKAEGVEGIFFVDDNITLNIARFQRLCRALADAGTGGMEMIVQAAVTPLGRDPEVAEWMARAGIKVVFLGIESGNERNLGLYGKTETGRDARRAVENLQQNQIIAVGGLIVGNPDDTAEDVRETFRYARSLRLDHAIILSLQPYPRTPLRAELEKEGLVTNPDDYSRYNGFIVNVRTRHLQTLELARLIGVESVKMYLSPSHLVASRLTRRYRPFLRQLLKNGIDSFTGARRNRMFETTSSF